MQKKQAESQHMIDQNRQFVSALIIDKKRIRLKEANMPQIVMEQVPKRMFLMKVPLVKVKIGPQIITLFTDKNTLEALPVKKNCEAGNFRRLYFRVQHAEGRVKEKWNLSASSPGVKNLRIKLTKCKANDNKTGAVITAPVLFWRLIGAPLQHQFHFSLPLSRQPELIAQAQPERFRRQTAFHMQRYELNLQQTSRRFI